MNNQGGTNKQLFGMDINIEQCCEEILSYFDECLTKIGVVANYGVCAHDRGYWSEFTVNLSFHILNVVKPIVHQCSFS